MPQPPKATLIRLRKALRHAADPKKAISLKRFFKTGPGQYAEGDLFLGVVVPDQRRIAKEFSSLTRSDTLALLQSRIHEERLTALFILAGEFKLADTRARSSIASAYLKHLKWINNWDLVDSSAPQILGEWLLSGAQGANRKLLYKLARSKNLWERRIAILSSYAFIRAGETDDTLRLALLLLKDEQDLIHKAVGWMLREVGKRVSRQILLGFLDEHAGTMPRTALRYAIEHLAESERRRYLAAQG